MTAPRPAPGDLLPDGHDLADFLAGTWGKDVLVGRAADAPTGLLDLAVLEDVLRWNVLRHPFAVMTRAGKSLPERSYTSDRRVFGTVQGGYADGQKILAELADGATLYLNHLEEWRPEVGRHLAGWHPLPVGRTVCNAFITPAGTQSAALHYDDSHNFILQTAGTKRWRVYARPAGLDPSSGQTPPLDGELLVDKVLEPGDVLYMPPGFPHQAHAADELSVHLTFAAFEVMPTTVLTAVVDALYADDGWKRPPVDVADPVDRISLTLREIGARIGATDPEHLAAVIGGAGKTRRGVADLARPAR
ncbi:hypothetical protein JOF53_000327 [Crossiella equi]|uniref:JmjC domain-containing protein n=1 Tax=Crossiella equi TaxID=130796 RepID=A0ABS5A4F0_9PSEU|nr:cupin domain-containing protein [Crossiella equi]MBP2471455.1 hypothetical protein [Crossiella equi]